MQFRLLKTILRRVLPPSLLFKLRGLLDRGHFDEVRMIHSEIRSADPARVMLDVGACHGVSLYPFARDGWQVFAFELVQEECRGQRGKGRGRCRVHHFSAPLTPADSKVAISRRIRSEASSRFIARTAPVPSPSRICRSKRGRNPR